MDKYRGGFKSWRKRLQREKVEGLKLAERKIITVAHRFNLSATAWPFFQYYSEVKNEAWMKEALIEVLGGR